MIIEIALAFGKPVLITTDSWFGNNGLWKPLYKQLGSKVHMVSRLRSNLNISDLPCFPTTRPPGRPRKYGKKLANTSSVALQTQHLPKEYLVDLYGKTRKILAHEQIAKLNTLKCPVKVVLACRKKQWVALFSTDTTLSVEQIVEYYGARWKIESGFKELKQDLGSAESQTRKPYALTNYLQSCMMASTITWIYADRIQKVPSRRRIAIKNQTHYAFSDVRHLLAKVISDDDFSKVLPIPKKHQ